MLRTRRSVACALIGLLPVLLGPALGAAASTPARVAPRADSSLTVISEEPTIVRTNGTFTIGLSIRSPFPPSELGIRLFVWPALPNVSDFGVASTGQPSYLLPAEGALPVAAESPGEETVSIAVSTTGAVASRTPPGAVPLVINCGVGQVCDGVYPVSVVLVDRLHDDSELASVRTHLIFVTHPSTIPLRVGLVLPVGEKLALSPAHTALLSGDDLTDLGEVIAALTAHPKTAVSLDLYPQLSVALGAATKSRLAQARLRTLSGLIERGAKSGSVELLRTPFVPLSVSALAAAGLGGELAAQLARAAGLSGRLDTAASSAPYVSIDNLSPAALALLSKAGVAQLVLPLNDVNLQNDQPQTAPFALLAGSSSPARGAPSALVTYPSLDSYLQGGGDPVLQAHELLAELAQIYFDAPYGSEQRGVVVAPSSLPSDPTALKSVLDTFLSGLDSNPILTASTVGGLFSQVPAGADNGGGETFNATSGALSTRNPAPSIPASLIDGARRDLRIYGSVAPHDKNRLSRLSDLILLAEADGISDHSRDAYAAPAEELLSALRGSLSISSGRNITLTARSGTIPITIKAGWLVTNPGSGPLHLVLRLSSNDDALTFSSGHDEDLVLTSVDNARSLKVSTRTSGAFDLNLELVSPVDAFVLLRSSGFSVRSTAISGVAIGLSLAALAVLVGWWLRSILRGRGRHAKVTRRDHRRESWGRVEVAPRD